MKQHASTWLLNVMMSQSDSSVRLAMQPPDHVNAQRGQRKPRGTSSRALGSTFRIAPRRAEPTSTRYGLESPAKSAALGVAAAAERSLAFSAVSGRVGRLPAATAETAPAAAEVADARGLQRPDAAGVPAPGPSGGSAAVDPHNVADVRRGGRRRSTGGGACWENRKQSSESQEKRERLGRPQDELGRRNGRRDPTLSQTKQPWIQRQETHVSRPEGEIAVNGWLEVKEGESDELVVC
ncbi:unnamed protein product [Phytophthora lilii]|uniref:Unnamed protein product n=1 Tax=Phytophthora lilii TaxID=2077276 RepID=A0A9W6UAU3_9STRA|nr:unnamed protein product [Phytophthora lilii]